MKTPRQRLKRLVDSGMLRYLLIMKNIEADVVDLIVDVVLRYCEKCQQTKKEPKP